MKWWDRLTLRIRDARIRQSRRHINYLQDMLICQCPNSDIARTIRDFIAHETRNLERLIATRPQEG